MVPDHAFDMQILEGNQAIVPRHPGRQFVLEVPALIGDVLMQGRAIASKSGIIIVYPIVKMLSAN